MSDGLNLPDRGAQGDPTARRGPHLERPAHQREPLAHADLTERELDVLRLIALEHGLVDL